MKDNATVECNIEGIHASEYWKYSNFNPQSKEDIFNKSADYIDSSFELKPNDETMLNCTDILLTDEDIQFVKMLADTVDPAIYSDKIPKFIKHKNNFVTAESWVLAIDNITNYIRIKSRQITFEPEISKIYIHPVSLEATISKQVQNKKLKDLILNCNFTIKISFALNLSIIIYSDHDPIYGDVRKMHVITTNQIGTRDKAGLTVMGCENAYRIKNVLAAAYSIAKTTSRIDDDSIELSSDDECKFISDIVTKVVINVLQRTNSYHLGKMVFLRHYNDKDGKTNNSIEYSSEITWDNASEVVPEFINKYFYSGLIQELVVDSETYPKTTKSSLLIEIGADAVISISFPLFKWYKAGDFNITCFNVNLKTAIDNFCKPIKIVRGYDGDVHIE